MRKMEKIAYKTHYSNLKVKPLKDGKMGYVEYTTQHGKMFVTGQGYK